MIKKNNTFYAVKRNNLFVHLYNSQKITKLCGSGPIFEVKVRELKKGEKSRYWGWKDFKEQKYSMIYPSKFKVEMCSPDGFKNKIKEKEGNLVNIIIEEIGN